MNKLVEKLKYGESGTLIYSLTPPKEDIETDKLHSLNFRRSSRISKIQFDAISIYDVQEEKSRNNEKRTFEYNRAINPINYGHALNVFNDLPQIIYLAVSKYSEKELQSIMELNSDKTFVLVGSPSPTASARTSLNKAWEITSPYENPIGGVLIGERHQNGNSEVQRVISKIEKGADFFISQCIYDYTIYKSFLEDYAVESNFLGYEIKPVILTFSPVGNSKSLDFLQWLGINIPDDFKQIIPESDDFLNLSIDYLEHIAKKLIDLCIILKIPFGINFESVIGKKAEVMASLELADRVSEFVKSEKYRTEKVATQR